MTVRIPLITGRPRHNRELPAGRCEYPGCGANLTPDDGVLLLSTRHEFRYCDSACASRDWEVHSTLAVMSGEIGGATDLHRRWVEAHLNEMLPRGVSAQIDWAGEGVVEVIDDDR